MYVFAPPLGPTNAEATVVTVFVKALPSPPPTMVIELIAFRPMVKTSDPIDAKSLSVSRSPGPDKCPLPLPA